MSERKINLEEIKHLLFNKHQVQYDDYDMSVFDDCMLEFGKQLLELAAEKAELKRDNYFSLSDAEQMVCIEIWNEADLVPSEGVVINKQSILDTIKQVE